MNETDAMRLLSDANPVLIRDVAPLELPALASRRRPTRLVLAIALVGAVAASLVGVFVFGGHATHPEGASMGVNALGGNGSWKTIAVSDASATLGAPVVLPETDLVQPSKVDAQAQAVDCPYGGDAGYPCTIFVHFPGPDVSIRYTRPAPDSVGQGAGEQPVDLSGVSAGWLASKQLIEFVVNGTWILVYGNHDEATLQAVAQSIVDQAPPGPPTVAEEPYPPTTNVDSPAAAQKLLPFDVVLPSDAAPTSLAVGELSHQLDAFFNTSATGPYELVEGPSSVTVAMLEEAAKRWTVGPIHEIDLVHGVEVLVQGWSDGSLVASWLRSDTGSRVITWISGPETAARGQVDGTFTKQQALSIASNLIAQGG